MRVVATERLPIKMWLDEIEEGALEQAKNLANLPFTFKHVALMPDSHQGHGVPIGGILATTGDVVMPNAVGVDIGCGMVAVRTSLTEIDVDTLKKVMGEVRKEIPVGFNHNKEKQDWIGFSRFPGIDVVHKEIESAKYQLKSLGGGNHFLEVQQCVEDGYIWVMIHSGSRNFGLKIAKTFHDRALSLCTRWYSKVDNKDLAFLLTDTQDGKEYISAMNYCLDFAEENRNAMMREVLRILVTETRCSSGEWINVHHNYAAMENHFGHNIMVHRKGAIRAREGEVGIIPGSMGTNSYITEGLGNADSFMSSSHGAGRRMGRKEAVRTLNLEDEQKKMVGIVHGLRNKSDLDEAPGSYKNIEEVMNNQKDLVKILYTLKPLASIKG